MNVFEKKHKRKPAIPSRYMKSLNQISFQKKYKLKSHQHNIAHPLKILIVGENVERQESSRFYCEYHLIQLL